MRIRFITVVVLLFLSFSGNSDLAFARSAERIDINVDQALDNFKRVTGADRLLEEAAGILVFPKVVKAGFVFGGEYGEGALRVDGETVDYYSTAAGSFGFQLGIQQKTIIMAFMTERSLDMFRQKRGWSIGADVSVAVIAIGAGGSIDTATLNEPIVAFVTDQKGLMYNVTLEGAKITRIVR